MIKTINDNTGRYDTNNNNSNDGSNSYSSNGNNFIGYQAEKDFLVNKTSTNDITRTDKDIINLANHDTTVTNTATDVTNSSGEVFTLYPNDVTRSDNNSHQKIFPRGVTSYANNIKKSLIDITTRANDVTRVINSDNLKSFTTAVKDALTASYDVIGAAKNVTTSASNIITSSNDIIRFDSNDDLKIFRRAASNVKINHISMLTSSFIDVTTRAKDVTRVINSDNIKVFTKDVKDALTDSYDVTGAAKNVTTSASDIITSSNDITRFDNNNDLKTFARTASNVKINMLTSSIDVTTRADDVTRLESTDDLKIFTTPVKDVLTASHDVTGAAKIVTISGFDIITSSNDVTRFDSNAGLKILSRQKRNFGGREPVDYVKAINATFLVAGWVTRGCEAFNDIQFHLLGYTVLGKSHVLTKLTTRFAMQFHLEFPYI